MLRVFGARQVNDRLLFLRLPKIELIALNYKTGVVEMSEPVVAKICVILHDVRDVTATQLGIT